MILFSICGILTGCARDTTVFLVRHAEKLPTGSDPALSPAGEQRAQTLANVLADSGITAIFTSDAQRTQQTAAPIAARVGLTPVVIAINNDPGGQSAETAGRIRADHAGQRVLVVGHSNTVPMIIEALGFTPAPAIDESEFDHFFTVLRRKDSPTRLIRTRYGD